MLKAEDEINIKFFIFLFIVKTNRFSTY